MTIDIDQYVISISCIKAAQSSKFNERANEPLSRSTKWNHVLRNLWVLNPQNSNELVIFKSHNMYCNCFVNRNIAYIRNLLWIKNDNEESIFINVNSMIDSF